MVRRRSFIAVVLALCALMVVGSVEAANRLLWMGGKAASTGPVYNPQATAFFARLATQPNTARKARYNTFFAALNTAGIYSQCDAVYAFQARDQVTALTNLIQASYGATITGPAIFSADLGITGDPAGGTSISSNLNPSTASGLNYTQNSAMIAEWSITAAAIHGAAMGYATNAYAEIRPNDTVGNVQTGALNSTTQSAGVSTSSGAGLLALDRSLSTGFTTYAQGVAGATTTSTSTALANAAINFLARANGSQEWSFGGIAFGFICGHLTAAQHLAIYNAIVAYRSGITSDYPTIRQIAGSRNDLPTINTTVAFATANTFNTRRMTYLNHPCANPSVVYTGWGYSIGDANFANPYTVHTQIEYGPGTFVNLTASGVNTMTVNAGDLFDATDIASGVTIPAGQVWIRSFITINNGGLVYLTDYAPNSAIGDLAQQGNGLSDATGGGTITTNMSFMVSGNLICEVPNTQRSIALMTDSNGQGVGGYIQLVDGNGSGGGIGYMAGYLDTVMSNRTTPSTIGGYLHQGRTGLAAATTETTVNIVDRINFANSGNINVFWNQLGDNDVNTGGSSTVAATNIGLTNGNYVRGTGGRIATVIQSTMVPQVTLTSTPPSDINQTDNSSGQVAALNTIIRAGTILNQTSFAEVGTEVENTTIPNINLWKSGDAVGYTHDGAHIYCQLQSCTATNAPGGTAIVNALIAANALSP